MKKVGLTVVAGLFAFISLGIQADQTGDCTAGEQYCEQNSLETTNTTTTNNTNTNTNTNNNTNTNTNNTTTNNTSLNINQNATTVTANNSNINSNTNTCLLYTSDAADE